MLSRIVHSFFSIINKFEWNNKKYLHYAIVDLELSFDRELLIIIVEIYIRQLLM